MTEADWLAGIDPAPLLRFAEPRLTDRHRLLFMAGCCRRVWDLLTDHRFRRAVEAAEAVADGTAPEDALLAAADDLTPPGQRVPPPADPLLREEARAVRTFRFGRAGHPTGVLNFHDLPAWCQQTYYAVEAIARRQPLLVAECCENAASHHAGDRVAQTHPLHEEIRALRDDVRRAYARAEDLRWRGATGRLEEQVATAHTLERETDDRIRRLTNEVWSAGGEERIRRAAAERAAQTDLVRCLIGNPFRDVEPDPRWFTSTVVSLARGIDADRAFDRLPILADALQDAGCENCDVLAHCRAPAAHTKGCWVVELFRRQAG